MEANLQEILLNAPDFSLFLYYICWHMRAIDVKPMGDFKISVVFDDGIIGEVDLNDLSQKGIFKVLQDPSFFDKVYTTGDAIAWSDELEIDALNIYAKIVKKTPAELIEKHFVHAAD